ncbi:MAG: methyltransferase domain-containing protein [Anaerolineae bacterium]|nr:methyltransferase domain-containing protein [Anaerolineae bacterium]
MANADWNASHYDTQHAYVWKFGTGVVELLAPQPGERILDLGCGTGHLTAQIAQSGATLVGLDSSPEMIQLARQHYPGLQFVVADAADFQVDEPFDAVFSNAALHWMRRPADVIRCVWNALKPGRRFVAEMGGQGNIQTIVEAVTEAMAQVGLDAAPLNPWYFPSLAEYAGLLERQGFEVSFAWLFDRPTLIDGGEAGMQQWLAVFCKDFLAAVPEAQREAVVRAMEDRLRPRLFRDGAWVADYRRLRIVAVKL